MRAALMNILKMIIKEVRTTTIAIVVSVIQNFYLSILVSLHVTKNVIFVIDYMLIMNKSYTLVITMSLYGVKRITYLTGILVKEENISLTLHSLLLIIFHLHGKVLGFIVLCFITRILF